MAVVDLLDLPSATAKGAPLVGLDLGTRTIGVAVSDTTWLIASPLALVERRKFTTDVETLFGLLETRGAAGLVVGLPVNMDGTEGPRCQSARAFARHLVRLRDLPLAFWDERLFQRGGEQGADLGSGQHPGAPRRRRRQDGRGLDPARRPGQARRELAKV